MGVAEVTCRRRRPLLPDALEGMLLMLPMGAMIVALATIVPLAISVPFEIIVLLPMIVPLPITVPLPIAVPLPTTVPLPIADEELASMVALTTWKMGDAGSADDDAEKTGAAEDEAETAAAGEADTAAGVGVATPGNGEGVAVFSAMRVVPWPTPDTSAIACSSCACRLPPSAVRNSSDRPSTARVSEIEPLTVVFAAGETTRTGTGDVDAVAEKTGLREPVTLAVTLGDWLDVADAVRDAVAVRDGDAVVDADADAEEEPELDAAREDVAVKLPLLDALDD